MREPLRGSPPIVPYREIDTVFLDVGNTLITMDLPRIARTLSSRGVTCSATELGRAEAAARPAVSARVAAGESTETVDMFTVYLRETLTRLPAPPAPATIGELAAQLARSLRPAGGSDVLWNTVLPGIPEALGRLEALGLRLVVVSNSDGTVERSLTRLGLRPFFAAVIDSGVVGFEKPNRQIFEVAIERSGASPARTLHFGDLYHVDVLGARNAGLHAALVDPFGDWEASAASPGGVDCDRFTNLGQLAGHIAAERDARR